MEQGLQTTGVTRSHRAVVLLALVLLADILFYDQPIGLSLAVFVLALGSGLLIVTGHPDRTSIAILTLATLPVIEDLNPLSAMILTLGLIIFALRAHHDPRLAWRDIPLAVVAFLARAPARTIIDEHTQKQQHNCDQQRY